MDDLTRAKTALSQVLSDPFKNHAHHRAKIKHAPVYKHPAAAGGVGAEALLAGGGDAQRNYQSGQEVGKFAGNALKEWMGGSSGSSGSSDLIGAGMSGSDPYTLFGSSAGGAASSGAAAEIAPFLSYAGWAYIGYDLFAQHGSKGGWHNAEKGAEAGAVAGSMFGPWGTAIGGVGGAIAGYLGWL